MAKNIYEGSIKLYKDDFQKLKDKAILVIGTGGVSSWACEFLVRSGLTNLTLVDMDDICFTNINRQVQATHSTVGQFKIDALKKRLLDINPESLITTIHDFFTPKSADSILNKHYDFVLDGFDSAQNKALLVSKCSEKNMPLILCGAAGGKRDLSKIELKNFKRVENDKLIRTVRRDIKKYYPEHFKRDYYLPCVYSTENVEIDSALKGSSLNCRGSIGSSGLVTASFGIYMSNYIMEYFLNDCAH